ncbi:HAMP domain-containing protein [Cryptosporangium phraense]|uniref:histidine kinase n=1 Tax=Cryptosporangium phraense TaxID=2593070 RepID=A0A545AW48_9ACTN|nr:HAMP domain-containing protein [Cryptosporangium phraense]TQS45550.1 HAMP domain-containing protein [Cryptosporangium phraense]
MTLRRRLAASLLAVVLGPLLLGAVAVGIGATRLAEERATERLDAAATVVGTAVQSVCQRARAASEALAATISRGDRPTAAATFVVTRGLADAARVENTSGAVVASAGPAGPAGLSLTDPREPDPGWGDCTRGTPPHGRPTLIAATVPLHRSDGAPAGRVTTALTITPADLQSLVRIPGVQVDALGTATRQRRIPPAPGRPLDTTLTTPAPDATALYGALTLVVLAAAGASLVAANVLARALTKPLQEVALAAEQVADGDLAARVPVRARDEIGHLAGTFNRMTRSMQAYVAALTAGRDQLRRTLALLGDTMSSTNDVDRILEVILESVVATTAAEGGIVLLARDSHLVGQRALGLAARGVRPSDVRVKVGEGLLGGVAATAEGRIGRVTADVHLSADEPDCRTFIAVPIVGPPHPPALPGGRLLGVLALYDRLGGDDFDDGDLLTVRSFAGQAAVALENALLHGSARVTVSSNPWRISLPVGRR